MDIVSDNPPLWTTNAVFDDAGKENVGPNIPMMVVDDGDIDAEIEEAGREIGKLSARLEMLLTKKAEMARRRVAPAEFFDPKTPEVKKMNDSSRQRVLGSDIKKRDLSLGPMEIQSGVRGTPGLGGIQEEKVSNANEKGVFFSSKYGSSIVKEPKKLGTGSGMLKIGESPAGVRDRQRRASIGPMEIRRKGLEVSECTPLRSMQSCRKSMLGGIEEEKVSNAGERGMCLSANSRPLITKTPAKKLVVGSGLKKIEESPVSTRNRQQGLSLGPISQSSREQGILSLGGIQEEKVRKANEKVMCFSAKSRSSIAKAPDIAKKLAVEFPGYPTSARNQRRGLSLGPSEIAAGSRYSCKIQDIKGEQEKKRRCSNASPKSGAAAKFSDLRKGVATVGPKRSIGIDADPSRIIKPKKLFQEVRNSAPGKTPSKGMKGRVVASRYSLAPVRASEDGSSKRKWSLPEAGKLEIACSADEKRSLSLGESSVNGGSVSSPLSIVPPMIRTIKRTMDTPRDSGCVKRVADLVGKESYFDHHALNFDE